MPDSNLLNPAFPIFVLTFLPEILNSFYSAKQRKKPKFYRKIIPRGQKFQLLPLKLQYCPSQYNNTRVEVLQGTQTKMGSRAQDHRMGGPKTEEAKQGSDKELFHT